MNDTEKLEVVRNLLTPVFNYFELSEKLNSDTLPLNDSNATLSDMVTLEKFTNNEYDKVITTLPLIKDILEED